MAIFFGIILAVAVGLTFYLVKAAKEANLPSKIVNFTWQDKNDLNEKIKANTDSNIEIPINSKELTAILSEGFGPKRYVIKNVQAVIDEKGINIYGTLVKPLSSQVKITAEPKVENGKIKMNILEMKIGKLSMPEVIAKEFEDSLRIALDQNFSALYENYEVINIESLNDKIIIGGKLLER